jgi:hypothetical protein
LKPESLRRVNFIGPAFRAGRGGRAPECADYSPSFRSMILAIASKS